MKLGLISDIHGNKVALDAVIQTLRDDHNVDSIACAGDILGVIGWPEEVAHTVQTEVDYCVYGNHDAYIRDDYSYVPSHPSQKQEHRVVTSELTGDSVEWVNNLPGVVEITDNVLMAHANPFVDNVSGFPADEYVDKRDWISFAADNMDGETVILGHTHDQGHLELDKFEGQSGKIINPGSVGAPYYEDARYAILDTETMESTLHRQWFDEAELLSRFDQLGLESASSLESKTVY
jgi:putative phosphoesterase